MLARRSQQHFQQVHLQCEVIYQFRQQQEKIKLPRPPKNFHHANKWVEDKVYTAVIKLTSHQHALCSLITIPLIPPPIDVFLVVLFCKLETILCQQEAHPRTAQHTSQALSRGTIMNLPGLSSAGRGGVG